MSEDTLKNLKLLYEKQSDFSEIKLYDTEDGRLMLVMCSFIQFIEGDDERNRASSKKYL